MLRAQVLQLLVEDPQARTPVPQGQLVLLAVLQLRPQLRHLRDGHREGLPQALVLVGDVEHELLVRDLLGLHLRHLVLQAADQLQIVVRDVVVVALHLAERPLVVAHQVVDVQVFPLLDLVDVHLPPQLESPSSTSLAFKRSINSPWCFSNTLRITSRFFSSATMCALDSSLRRSSPS